MTIITRKYASLQDFYITLHLPMIFYSSVYFRGRLPLAADLRQARKSAVDKNAMANEPAYA